MSKQSELWTYQRLVMTQLCSLWLTILLVMSHSGCFWSWPGGLWLWPDLCWLWTESMAQIRFSISNGWKRGVDMVFTSLGVYNIVSSNPKNKKSKVQTFLANHLTSFRYRLSKSRVKCSSVTYSTNKRIIGFFCKVSQSCSRIDYGPSVTRCRKHWRIYGQRLSIDCNTLQVQVIVWPESLDGDTNQSNRKITRSQFNMKSNREMWPPTIVHINK